MNKEALPRSEEMAPKLATLIRLAEANTEEGWKEIDSKLPQICNHPEVISWARSNTESRSDGLRDLAGTIFEASDEALTGDDVSLLRKLMDGDEGYPGFRAACALAKRGNSPDIAAMKKDIAAKLEKFVKDPDIPEIAEKYLEELGEREG